MTRRMVLVVDDDVAVARAVQGELSQRYDVTLAKTAGEALARMRERQADVILSDFDLGEPTNGVTLLSLVADSYPGTRRILYSGSPFTREACEVAHAILAKPVDSDELWEAVSTSAA